MSATLMEFYLPLKSLHIISVVLWMAGLIYLPSILAHHSRVAKILRPLNPLPKLSDACCAPS